MVTFSLCVLTHTEESPLVEFLEACQMQGDPKNSFLGSNETNIFFGSSFDTSVIWSLEYKLGLVGPTMPGYDIVCDLYLFIYCCT